MTDETLVAQVMHNVHDAEQIGDVSKTLADAIHLPPLKQKLAALALCKRMFRDYDILDTMRWQPASLRRAVHQEHSYTIQKTTLKEFIQ